MSERSAADAPPSASPRDPPQPSDMRDLEGQAGEQPTSSEEFDPLARVEPAEPAGGSEKESAGDPVAWHPSPDAGQEPDDPLSKIAARPVESVESHELSYTGASSKIGIDEDATVGEVSEPVRPSADDPPASPMPPTATTEPLASETEPIAEPGEKTSGSDLADGVRERSPTGTAGSTQPPTASSGDHMDAQKEASPPAEPTHDPPPAPAASDGAPATPGSQPAKTSTVEKTLAAGDDERRPDGEAAHGTDDDTERAPDPEPQPDDKHHGAASLPQPDDPNGRTDEFDDTLQGDQTSYSHIRDNEKIEKNAYMWGHKDSKSLLYAELDGDGGLTLLADMKRSPVRGRTIFRQVMAAFGDRVKTINGNLVDENKASYIRALASGLTPEEAAFETWTGKMAREHMFTKILHADQEAQDGVPVRLRFGRPE